MKRFCMILTGIMFLGCVRESEKIVNDAQAKAEQILNDAQKKADQIQSTREKELHKIFNGLERYQEGKNIVNRHYLSNFVLNKRDIKYTFINERSEPVQPRFTIYFVNTYGFITGKDFVGWIFDKVSKDETRIYENHIALRFGEPTYYFLEFE